MTSNASILRLQEGNRSSGRRHHLSTGNDEGRLPAPLVGLITVSGSCPACQAINWFSRLRMVFWQSRMISCTNSSQLGMPWISPCTMPEVHTP